MRMFREKKARNLCAKQGRAAIGTVYPPMNKDKRTSAGAQQWLDLQLRKPQINMSTAVSHDIRISVRAHFEAGQSDPVEGRFIFSYRITIANRGHRVVQLMRRTWYIADSLAPRRKVEGPGVVGATPVLAPGEQFTYTSFCDLRSGWGRMQGNYLMRHTDDGSEFEAAIPPFDLQQVHTAN